MLASVKLLIAFGSFALDAHANVHVEGTARCPSAAAVEARLAPMWPAASPPEQATARAVVEDHADGTWVTLWRSPQEMVATRRLTATGSCAERAEQAAVLLASWAANLRSGWSASLAPPLGTPPPRSVAGVHAGGGPRSRSAAVTWEIAAASGLVGTADGAAPTFIVEPTFRLGPLLVARISAAVTDAIEREYGASATVRWSRRSLAGGVWWHRDDPGARVFVAAGVSVSGSQLVVAGRGFDEDRSTSSLDPGVALHARAGGGRGRWQPWVELSTTWWPRPQTVRVEGGARVDALPPAGLVAVVGVTYRPGK